MALLAAGSTRERLAGFQDKVRGQVRGIGPIGLSAVGADRSHQPLGHHARERTGHEERLDAHIEKPRRRGGRVVRVQGAEHKVARQGGLNGSLCGFEVANFTDHHHVRVMTQNVAKPTPKREANLAANGNLADRVEMIFHRIFDGDDLDLRRDDFL